MTVDTNPPYTVNFDYAVGRKTNYVSLRQVSPTGERGPWSDQT